MSQTVVVSTHVSVCALGKCSIYTLQERITIRRFGNIHCNLPRDQITTL